MSCKSQGTEGLSVDFSIPLNTEHAARSEKKVFERDNFVLKWGGIVKNVDHFVGQKAMSI